MGIVEEDIQRVKDAADLVGVASEHIAVRKQGRRWVGLCPFHQEKSPSFSINAEEGFYHCFGCQASGDIITFVMELEHLDFVSAVERLAARAGINLRYDDADQGQDRSRRARLVEQLERAVEWYHQRLLSGADAGRARGYLRDRGLDGDVVRQFRIGWAPDEWDALGTSLDLSTDVLEGTGLGFVNRLGKRQDAFRARILFPIFDAAGSPIGFGGRVMPGGEGPKYKNTQETTVYRKSRALYGLNWAKADAVKADEVVVCEGYTDVIGFHQAGIPRAVATCGTALTEDHIRILRRFARRLVLAFDADSAGQAAAARVYEWEQEHDLDVVVAAFPAGVDPAEAAQDDPAVLERAVSGARPFLGFRLSRLLDSADLTTPEGRARAAGAAMAAVNEHPNPLVRDQYLMEVADRCHLTPERLRSGNLPAPRPQRGARQRGAAPVTGTGSTGHDHHEPPLPRETGDPGPTGGGRSSAGRGGYQKPQSQSQPQQRDRDTVRMKDRAPETPADMAICLMIHDREAIADLLQPVLLPTDNHRDALAALRTAGGLRVAVETAPEGAAALLSRLGAQETEADAVDVCALLASERAAAYMRELQAQARQSTDPKGYAPVIAWLKRRMEELQSDSEREQGLAAVTPWLTEQAPLDQTAGTGDPAGLVP